MDQYQSQFAYMAPPPPPPPAFMSTPPTQYLTPPYASQSYIPSPAVLPCTSVIGADTPAPCYIYRQDEAGGLADQMCQQICLPDGRMFIEHVPNHCVVYVPLGYSLAQTLDKFQQNATMAPPPAPPVLPPLPLVEAANAAAASRPKGRSHSAKQTSKPRSVHSRQQSAAANASAIASALPSVAAKKPKEKSNKPINAFIKYRSYKIAELKRLHPEASQTEISRLAGECWKTESEDVKNQFRIQYLEEKKIYDMKKATMGTKRSRDDSSSGSSDTESLPPAGFDGSARRRSLTLPASDTTACTRAASASPMMLSKPPAAKRRRCVTEDMRKQLATKSLDMSSYYGPFSFEDMTPMLAPLVPPTIDTSLVGINPTPLELYSAADFAASISTFMSTTSDSQN
ncbi:hypothetical protein IW140_004974 [Coemansia sp. RSA 1813]|nr:hypothetical protein EV178_005574 [Coemansia sp. RSA 1646]KAJ1768548.1 hypothetical protein LPJ74_004786 [Coemansia sp. RSA 1843]KAJ2086159.1 hypothetical protein IW138_005875 [Coemansia sp. RSA 986]KAJ2210838.1 hypothetical protein EV179_005957 [Coemansia sp. RSA 487]KAJ2566286.1 hypothetical protein IW140_004974 [Coemansia sp. RSA 1813]